MGGIGHSRDRIPPTQGDSLDYRWHALREASVEHAPSTKIDLPSIDEILEHHEGEWLLIKVLDTAVPLGESPGEVLSHGPDRNAMFKAERKARKLQPGAVLAILGGGTGFADGDAFRRELARVAAEEKWISVKRW